MDSDSEDEAQDWRTINASVLKRGEKDHAPDGTEGQQNSLQQSREAMYSALSQPASSSVKNIVECDWIADRKLARVRKLKGNFFTTMGFMESGCMYLRPEELIYLVQRGTAACYNANGQKLAVQGAMALALPAIGSDNMLVYSHLRRLGYVVHRAVARPSPASRDPWNLPSIDSLVWLVVGRWLPRLAWKPFYSRYEPIYRDLAVVRSAPIRHAPAAESPFTFHVWKPNTKFKKSQPPEPDFQVIAVSAQDPLPSLEATEAIFESLPPSTSTKHSVITRIRDGRRKYTYAVVDNGIVAFVTATQTSFEPSIHEPPR